MFIVQDWSIGLAQRTAECHRIQIPIPDHISGLSTPCDRPAVVLPGPHGPATTEAACKQAANMAPHVRAVT